MQTKKKVVIVGAGPAGLGAASELARNESFEVIVLERNSEPSYKVCGGGIHPDFIKDFVSQDVLDREFEKILIKTPRSTYTMKYDKNIFMGTLNRKKLNEELTKKAEKAGAQVLFGKAVKEIQKDKVLTTNGEEFSFDYLIGADGATSVVRKSLNIPTENFIITYQYIIPGDYENVEIHVDFKKFGITYSWIFPQKGVISVGTGYSSAEEKSPGDVKKLRENFDAWCKERFSLEGARFEGFTINYDYRGFEFGNVYLCGDAGGFASGFTGEGMKPAILTGIDVARKIQDPNYKCINVEAYLAIKKREEGILKLLISRPWGRLFTPIAAHLANSNWIKKMLFKFIDMSSKMKNTGP
ncbi:MAG: NAD(P)/FAD-dependent oxidoreductase [Candidatus Pacebacteria bacterium]|nr:NAD(P)/FAD-dependent oxidoreductase [Candidatus Paceibacterota bacterium]